MNIKCISALALLLPAVVFAQGKPSQPGPPSTQPQLQYLVDATGKVVGETSGGITSVPTPMPLTASPEAKPRPRIFTLSVRS